MDLILQISFNDLSGGEFTAHRPNARQWHYWSNARQRSFDWSDTWEWHYWSNARQRSFDWSDTGKRHDPVLSAVPDIAVILCGSDSHFNTQGL
jgi:hypothetical protein